jgi:MFS family permease
LTRGTAAKIEALDASGPHAGVVEPYAWWVVVVLTLAAVGAYIDRQILAVLVEPIKRDLAISDTQVSLLLGLAFAVFYTGVGLLAGWLSDRINRRNILVAGSLVWSAMTAAGGFARGFHQLLGARLGVGLGEACLNPTAIALLSDYFPKGKMGRAMGVYAMGLAIGGGIATVVGGTLLPRLEAGGSMILPLVGAVRPWQGLMMIVGTGGLLVTVLLTTVREPRERPAAVRAPAIAFGAALRFIGARWAAYAGLCWPMAAGAVLVIGVGSWIPAFFQRSYGLSHLDAGHAIRTWGLIQIAGTMSGVFAGGWLSDALVRRRNDGHVLALLCAMLVSGPASALFPLAPSPTFALLLLAPAAFGSGMLQACGPVSLMGITPAGMRGTVAAAYFFSLNVVGVAIGPTAVALLTDHVFGSPQQVRYALTIVAAVAATTGVAAILAARPAYRRLLAASPQPGIAS